MRNMLKLAGVFLLVAVAVACAVPLLPHTASAAVTDWGPMLMLVGAIGQPVMAKAKRTLQLLSNPVQANQNEALAHIIYDSLTYTSGTTTQLNFFGAANADPTLSNMPNGGTLEADNWLEVYNLGFDVLIDGTTTAGTEAGAIDDIQKLMLVGRPTFTLILAQKNYGPYPLRFLHTSGGAWGVVAGTFTAEEQIQFANNSVPDGGWNWFGSMIIPPIQGFRCQVNWNAAQTLAAGNSVVSLWLSGVLHRPVK